MARLVVHTATGPKKIKTEDGEKMLCMCGLSKNKPFCDGSHKKVQNEEKDVMECYDENGKKLLMSDEEEKTEGKKDGCCGGGCCN